METIQGLKPEISLQKAIETIYLNLDKGKEKDIPAEFMKEYKEYASKRFAKIGNSARASNKRMFLLENASRVFPKEYRFAKDRISSLYEEGNGLKRIAKMIGLTYTRMRTLFNILGIEINKGTNVVYGKTRLVRSENLKKMYEKRTGWFRTFERKTNKASRGIQGYYYNNSRSKFVWLRSTYEYIYAKWLDRQGVDWDVEQQTFDLEGTTYRPDFFIYEDGVLVKIVEIKGYWARGTKKTDELSAKLDIDVVLIRDIEPYCDKSYKKELLEWKLQRRSNERELNK